MPHQSKPPRNVLLPHEVAVMFSVDTKTVTRWAKAGRIASFRTPGGHRRYYRADVEKMTRPERGPQ